MGSRLAIITFLDGNDGGLTPGYPLPGAPVYPSQGLPGGPVYPSQGLPVYPSQGLPGTPGHPSQGLPPTLPDNELPAPPEGGHPWLPGAIGGGRPPVAITLPVYPPEGSTKPITDLRFVLKWLACHGWVLVPDNELPATPAPKK